MDLGKPRAVEGGVLLEYESVGSTMDVARECVRAGRTDVIGVRADYQERGRGRLGRAWSAPPGACLLVTYIFAFPLTADLRTFAFASAVAVADAVQEITGVDASIKWPNDLLVGSRKLGGILVENLAGTRGEHGGAVLVGIGLNVNVASFLSELERAATSLRIESGAEWEIERLEAEVRQRLAVWLRRAWLDALLAWRSRDATAGTPYVASTGSGQVSGVAEGVTDSGLLLLRLDDGRVVETANATSAAMQ